MGTRLYVAPAARGKTSYVLDLVRDAATGLASTPRVVVPTGLQVRSWRRRLAEAGGCLGVRVLTFDRLYAECLHAAGHFYTPLSEPVQYRLIRSVVDRLPLEHYAPLVRRPGFIHILAGLIAELQAGRIGPDAFEGAVAAMGGEPRLAELACVYSAYRARLQSHGWADHVGLGELAVQAVDDGAPAVARDWPLLVVDGFDNFTPVQLDLLRLLGGRVGEMVVTLTQGDADQPRPLVHRRTARALDRLRTALSAEPIPLPAERATSAPALIHLERELYRGAGVRAKAGQAVELLEAPDRAAEVREALRWIKARLVEDGLRPGDVALLARNVVPYRPMILQVAAEFGLAVRPLDGLPLRGNPAIMALLDLLRLMLPLADGQPEPACIRRLVVEAWRSPYFDWSALPADGSSSPIGISDGDADVLDRVARRGRIIAGLSQWQEVLDRLASREASAMGHEEDDEMAWPADIPQGDAARALRDTFGRFIQRLTPPAGRRTYREFVGWLETLIGADPALSSPRFPAPEEPTALGMVARIRQGPATTLERDLAALQCLKEVLRGLVWAEESLADDADPSATAGVEFPTFFAELSESIEAASYHLPWGVGREEVVVANVIQARGVPFRAVAVLGLAEGEFPAAVGEDPFLRDADRELLREGYGLQLERSAESAEVEFFYETITRPRERLLLTRPRLAENGAPWQASPFWEEVRRRVDVEPRTLTSESLPPPSRAASVPELIECLAAGVRRALPPSGDGIDPERLAALETAARIFTLRGHRAVCPFDGDLSARAGDCCDRYGPRHVWSASRLETYRKCPFGLFLGHVLGLEPREEPAEGLDGRQLGNIYHHILKAIYGHPDVDPTNLEELLAALPAVAGRILDEAPEREGFRETAWWRQTRDEIVENVGRSLENLAALSDGYAPYRLEAAFGFDGQPPLVIRKGFEEFRLHGRIDRVDQAPDGRVRIIDYKTAGPDSYRNRQIRDGDTLQLPLYALAARDALGLGTPAEGFYWHVQNAEPSPFRMSTFDGGPQAAMEVATEKALEAVAGVRAGRFSPEPAHGDCPSYCAGAGICWHYRPSFGA